MMTAAVTNLHFCPTARARENLLAEHIPAERIRVVGNTVIDALHLALERLRGGEVAARSLAASFPALEVEKPFVLVTGHRRESFGKPFEELCLAIRDVAQAEEIQFVYPVHLNPNVRQPVFEILRGLRNVHLGEPVGYPELVSLLQRCRSETSSGYPRSEEHTSELQSRLHLVCRLLLEKKKILIMPRTIQTSSSIYTTL